MSTVSTPFSGPISYLPGSDAPEILVDATQLDPLLLELGVLAGLFTRDATDPTSEYRVDATWFRNPVASVRASFARADAGDQLLDLLERFLSSHAGSTIGVPQRAADNRLWYPIDPSADPPLPVYLVSEATRNGTLLGIGALQSSSGASTTAKVTVYAFVPVLRLAKDGQHAMVLGTSDSPIEIGAYVGSTTGGFGATGATFDGLAITLRLPLDASNPPTVDVVLRNLALGARPPADMSLSQLEHLQANDWLSTVITLLGAQIAAADDGHAADIRTLIDDLLAMLGLTGSLPPLDWASIVSGDTPVPDAVRSWLSTLASQPSMLRGWLSQLARLLGVGSPTIVGSGTRADPYAVQLSASPGAFELWLTFAVAVDAQDSMSVVPGLQVKSTIRPIPDDSSPRATQLVARAELAELVVSASETPQATEFLPSFAVRLNFFNRSPDQPLFAVASPAISVGSASFGFDYANINGTRQIAPAFTLSRFSTSGGAWPVIDLSNYNNDIKIATAAAADIVGDTLTAFFGADDTPTNTPGRAFAALLGLVPPAGVARADWQVKLLLDAEYLALLMHDPVAALGAYHRRCLETDAGAAWRTLMPSLAVLLGAASSGHADGTGTRDDPWRVPIAATTDGTATASLQAWKPAADGARLMLGLRLDLSVSTDPTVSLGCDIDLLSFTLPGPSDIAAHAAWMGAVRGRVELAGATTEKGIGELITPWIAGMRFRTSQLAVHLSWAPATGLVAEASVRDLHVDTTADSSLPALGSLSFSLPSFSPGINKPSWNVGEVQRLGAVALDIVGLWLARLGGRFGAAVGAILGLLPSPSAFFSGGATPDVALSTGVKFDGWPTLHVDIDNPFGSLWAALRAQMQSLFGDSARGAEAARLLRWSFVGKLPAPGTPTGSGTYADPFAIPFENAGNLELLLWLRADASQAPDGIHFGVRRRAAHYAGGDVRMTSAVRADLAHIPAAQPRLAFSARFDNATGGPLVTLSDATEDKPDDKTSIDYADVGVIATPDGVVPTITVRAHLRGIDGLTDFTLARAKDGLSFTCSQPMQQFESLLFSVVSTLSSAAAAEAEESALHALLDVLFEFGLVSRTDPPVVTYAIDGDGWRALLAKPDSYLRSRANDVFDSVARRADIAVAVERLLGLTPVTPSGQTKAVWAVLSALGLAREVTGGYVPVVSAILAAVTNPRSFLDDALTTVLVPRATQQLASRLTAAGVTDDRPSPPTGVCCWRSSTGVFTLELPPEAPFVIADGLWAYGRLTIDTRGRTANVHAAIAARDIGAAIAFSLDADASGTPSTNEASGASVATSWRLALEPAPGDRPAAFAPVIVYPLPADVPNALASALTDELPRFVLSAVASELLNEIILTNAEGRQRPTACAIAALLGLTGPDGTSIRSVRGVLEHPRQWLLSPSVLGDGSGNLDANRAAMLLANVAAAAGGVTDPKRPRLRPSDDARGVTLDQLPYGATVTLSARSDGVRIEAGAGSSDDPVSVHAGVTCAPGGRLAIDGAAKVAASISDGPSSKSIAVDVAFGAAGWSVLVHSSVAGTPHDFTLVPFSGMSSIIGGDTKAQLLAYAAARLADAYDATPEDVRTQRLDPFLGIGKSVFGIASADDAVKAAHDIATTPVEWLSSKFTPAGLATLAPYLASRLRLPGFAVMDGKLAWTIGDASSGATIVFAGPGTDSLGVTITPHVKRQWLVLDATLTASVSPAGPRYSLRSGLRADLSAYASSRISALGPGPALVYAWDGSSAHAGTLRLYVAGQAQTKDTLVLGLLPSFAFELGDGSTPAVADWMRTFAIVFFVPLIANVPLSIQAVRDWLATPVRAGGTLTYGGLLEAIHFFRDASGTLADLRTFFQSLSPQSLLVGAINAIVDDGATLYASDKRNIVVSLVREASKDDPSTASYGLRLSATDLEIGKSNDAKRDLTLQLGAYQTSDTADANWMNGWGSTPTPAPGIRVFVVDRAGDTFTFRPRLELVSIGLNWNGAGGKPLAALQGFTLGGIEPRVSLTMAPGSTGIDATFDAGIRCDNVGLPLGPSSAKGSAAKNPVAEDLLSHGPSSGESNAVNPKFNVAVSYADEHLAARILGADGQAHDVVWFPVGRALGPLFCQKIGVDWRDPLVDVHFDGSVAFAGLEIDLDDLTIGVPARYPLDRSGYTLGLHGINVSFQGGPVDITGGFLEEPPSEGKPVSYIGNAIVRAAAYTLAAAGAYSVIAGEPSLFVFAQLGATLGGPPMFFVTGVAAGFGYNRTLRLPPVDGVRQFPLVTAAIDPAPGGDDRAGMLQRLGDAIQPQSGAYWLAAGVKFTSFELIHSFALLATRFGRDFEISLLGTSTLQLPKDGNPYLFAELGLEVNVDPGIGVFSALAQLTPRSWVIDPACRLTGGFAFNAWFHPGRSDVADHNGDFVLTIGGYHPQFVKPTHYPDVPRLGFNWPMSSNITIKGGAYFALTPSCVMAGGNLDASYQSGDLHAWFDAYADFLISWHPFHYDIGIGVSVGASYRLNLLFCTTTVSVELGASVHLWGPPLEGEAHINWWVISFTIAFGATDQVRKQPLLDWTQFRGYFLPANAGDVCRVTIVNGLAGEIKRPGKPSRWFVNPAQLAFATESAVPATTIAGVGTKSVAGDPIGVRPIGSLVVTSTQTFSIGKYEHGPDQPPTPVDITDWAGGGRRQNVPAALWNTVNDGREVPGAAVMPNRLTGYTNIVPPAPKITLPAPFDIAGSYDTLPPLPLGLRAAPVSAAPLARAPLAADVDPIERVHTRTMADDAVDLRGAVLAALRDLGRPETPNGRLDLLAAYADITFQSEPMLGTPGGSSAAVASSRGPRTGVVAARPAPAFALPPRDAPALRAVYRVARPMSRSTRLTARCTVDGTLATAAERRAVAGFLRAPSGDGVVAAASIDMGTTLLWEMDRMAAPITALASDGALPIRVIGFDAHEQVVMSELCSSAGQIALTTDISRLAVSVCDVRREYTTAEWRFENPILALTPTLLLADGLLVHALRPFDVGDRVAYRHGVLHGWDILDARSIELVLPREADALFIDVAADASIGEGAVVDAVSVEPSSPLRDAASPLRFAGSARGQGSVRVSYTVARPERVPLAIRVATGPFALRGVSTRTSLPATVDPKAPATRRATVRFFT